MYLGDGLRFMKLENVMWSQAMSLNKYVRNTVQNCELCMADHFESCYTCPKSEENTLAVGYIPKWDMGPELEQGST